MRPLCVVPARRGSKRLPFKNLRDLDGKPMFVYSIEAALASGIAERVFVSTEDEEIADVARRNGAEVHRRPAHLAGDLAGSDEVCIDVYERRLAAGDEYGAVVCLQPSSPLRTAKDIRGAWERFMTLDADFLVSVTPIDPHYFHWALRPQGDWWEMYFGETYMMERPLLPVVQRPNGSIKIAKAAALGVRRNFFGPRLAVYETPEERSIHVATQFDFDLALYLLRARRSSA
jgi:CMP-N-acetylneuraminic acid synthetase